jgi:hypothetical protein
MLCSHISTPDHFTNMWNEVALFVHNVLLCHNAPQRLVFFLEGTRLQCLLLHYFKFFNIPFFLFYYTRDKSGCRPTLSIQRTICLGYTK